MHGGRKTGADMPNRAPDNSFTTRAKNIQIGALNRVSGPRQGSGPSRGAVPDLWWATRDVRSRLAPRTPASGPPAPRELRWETAPPFPQLRAPRGSNPLRGPRHGNGPSRGAVPDLWWATRDVRSRLAPRTPASGPPAPRELRWETAPPFPQLRAPRGSNPLRGPRHGNGPSRGAVPDLWWATRDSNPQPCACKAPALTVAPVARKKSV